MQLFRRHRPASPAPLVEGHIIASRALFRSDSGRTRPGEPARFLYWEHPDHRYDSGWRVFTGLETEQDEEDPDTFLITYAPTLVTLHPHLAPMLVHGVRGAWEWDDAACRFVKVPMPKRPPL